MITFIHRLVFSSHLTLYIVMGCAHLMNGQEVKTAEFIAAVRQLQSGEIDSLSLSFGGSLPIKQFQFEGWEYFNRHELKGIERDPLSASKFRPLVKEDIVRSAVANQKLNIEGEHPAPFPQQIVLLPILQTSKEGDLVLDPFVGSGTVGKVCDEVINEEWNTYGNDI